MSVTFVLFLFAMKLMLSMFHIQILFLVSLLLSDCVQTVPSLDQLFYAGKLVRCKITDITTKRSKKVVSLTLNPKDVNRDVKTVKSGMVR